MAQQTHIRLNDGIDIPQIGLGVWQVENRDAAKVVKAAIDAGYRSIDTAAIYGNEEGVGAGIRAAGVPREQLFITTKLWNDKHGAKNTFKAFDESLKRLNLRAEPSEGNFVLVRFSDAAAAAEHLKRKGILVRRMDSYGLAEHLRITIGTAADMDRVLQALSSFDQ